MTHHETTKSKLEVFDAAHEACRRAREQLDLKIEQHHSGGPCPTEADYKVWTDAVAVLKKAGEDHRDEISGSHAK
jgi:hypothetical protein